MPHPRFLPLPLAQARRSSREGEGGGAENCGSNESTLAGAARAWRRGGAGLPPGLAPRLGARRSSPPRLGGVCASLELFTGQTIENTRKPRNPTFTAYFP